MSVKRHLFFYNTISVLTALVAMLLVNGVTIHFTTENYRRQSMESMDVTAAIEVQELLQGEEKMCIRDRCNIRTRECAQKNVRSPAGAGRPDRPGPPARPVPSPCRRAGKPYAGQETPTIGPRTQPRPRLPAAEKNEPCVSFERVLKRGRRTNCEICPPARGKPSGAYR